MTFTIKQTRARARRTAQAKVWADSGRFVLLSRDENDEDDLRLHGQTQLFGVAYSVEAVPVAIDSDGRQVGVGEYAQDRLDVICEEWGSRSLHSVDIDGVSYVVLIVPMEGL